MVVLYEVIYWGIELLENCREVFGKGTSRYLQICGQIEMPKQKWMNRLHLLLFFNWPPTGTDADPPLEVSWNLCIPPFDHSTWWQRTWWLEQVLWLRLDSRSSDLFPFPPGADLPFSALNSCSLPLTHQCLRQQGNFCHKPGETSGSTGTQQIFAL